MINWIISTPASIPDSFINCLKEHYPTITGNYLAQILWQKNIRTIEEVKSFFDPQMSLSPYEFGQEMKQALKCLKSAHEKGKKVLLWGDCDIDGLITTTVLWEGLGVIFPHDLQLNYYIPQRFKESYGLDSPSIEKFAQEGVKVIIVCDTGSHNLLEITLAKELGIEVIILDHHYSPEDRPPVVSMLNSLDFGEDHPFFVLSGVGIAYKLMEAVYDHFSEYYSTPVTHLLDLVGLGLINDLVELTGENRYLLKRALKELEVSVKKERRPAISILSNFCQENGIRSTDFYQGLGRKLKVISHFKSENFIINLLTNRNQNQGESLAKSAKNCYIRHRELQRSHLKRAESKLSQINDSTTSIIVLDDPLWAIEILPLVAEEISKNYHCPVILLNSSYQDDQGIAIAKGSAYSVNDFNFYPILEAQKSLLREFGGHPYAMTLTIPVENIPLFKEAINQQALSQKFFSQPYLRADLTLTLAEITPQLYEQLKFLQPYGIGNLPPRFLIKNCYFKDVVVPKNATKRKQAISHPSLSFTLIDPTCLSGIHGIAWDKNKHEIPINQSCDIMVELYLDITQKKHSDFTYKKEAYGVRLIDFKLSNTEKVTEIYASSIPILDYRQKTEKNLPDPCLNLTHCPQNWQEFREIYEQAEKQGYPLVLNYPTNDDLTPEKGYKLLIGIAKHLLSSQEKIFIKSLQSRLKIVDRTLCLALKALKSLGFEILIEGDYLSIPTFSEISPLDPIPLQNFLKAMGEDYFRQDYFRSIELELLQVRSKL